MQGIHPFIPTEVKARYLNQLLKVGFDVLDFGSFVSPKAIPQLRDTAEVLGQLDLSSTPTELLAIVANRRGAEQATAFDEITYLGYPFSVSETFQRRNTNAGLEASLARLADIASLATQHGKKLVVYISMAFGNPYGDPWSPELVSDWASRLARETGASTIALSDTVGSSTGAILESMFKTTVPANEGVEISAHLHSRPDQVTDKISGAYRGGCRSFDGALRGYGGCPMAKDDLTGNLPTEMIVRFAEQNAVVSLNREALQQAMAMVPEVFPLNDEVHPE